MAIIHNTTMTPGKLELLAAWLPVQPWYLGPGRDPELTRSGGFRLDDPDGEVGIEFMVVTDGAGDQPAAYLVPMTYRGDAMPGADDRLIGTSEHGVLGLRWIYDGIGDPVLVAQLVALIQGEAGPQAQNRSDTPDPTVIGTPVTAGPLMMTSSAVAANGPASTDLEIETADASGARNGQLSLRISRVLQPEGGDAAADGHGKPCLSATWRQPDGTRVRGVFATARYR